MKGNLNAQQKAAVEHIDGALVVIAGPGTGKTHTLISKVEYLVKEKKAVPEKILALTFTNKAASEMRERLKKTKAGAVHVYTFHALAHELLSKVKSYTIIDSSEQESIIREIIKTNSLKYSLKELKNLISLYKNSLNKAEFSPDVEKIVGQYNSDLRREKLYDYDDLIVTLFEELNKKIFTALYDFVFVDEFQDTTPMQYKIAKMLVATDNLCVIGDPLQSIYSFRGAHEKIFEQFRQDFPLRHEVTLSDNYRSGSSIIEVSSRLFPFSQKLIAQNNKPGAVFHVTTLNEYTQAEFILTDIASHIGGLNLNQSGAAYQKNTASSFKDFAVIYRTHNTARILEKVFYDSGIPYQTIGGDSIFEESSVKKIIEELEMIDGNSSEKLSEAVKKIVEEKRLTVPPQFYSTTLYFDRSEESIALFLEHVQYLREHEYYDKRADAVTLLTMHRAKGLEFKHVYIIGFEEGIIPYIKEHERELVERFEEEKRLFYVALTRAKQELTLFSTIERFGAKAVGVSPFKKLIEGELLTQVRDERIDKVKKKREKVRLKKAQGSLF